MTRNLLVITHDDIETLDRRIVNEARVFIDHGWTVQVLCLTSRHKQEFVVCEPNLLANAIPLCQIKPPIDPLFDNWHRIVQSDQPHASWPRKFLRRFGYHLSYYRMLFRLVVAIRFLPNRLKQAIKHQLRYHLAPYPRLQNSVRKLSSFRRKTSVGIKHIAGQPQPAAFQRLPGNSYPLPFTDAFIEYGCSMKSTAIMACDLPALPAAHELAQRWGVPLIYDSHEYYVEQSAFGPRHRFIMEQHESRCLRQTDLFMTVSDRIAEDIQRKYHLADCPKVLYNASAFQQTDKGSEQSVRDLLGIPTDALMLLHHGGLVATRNLERLMTRFAKVAPQDTYLVFIGYGDHKKALARLAAQVGKGRILVRDAVPQDDLPLWIRAADAVVIPYPATEKNNEFCMPNKLSDCIELGCPMIGNSNLLCVGDILQRYRLGVSGPMDSDDDMESTLQQGLQWLRDGRLQEADFASARAYYGPEAQREKLIGWLQELKLPGFVREPSSATVAA